MRLLIATCRAFLAQEMSFAHDDRLLMSELTSWGIDACAVCWDDSTVQWDKADPVVLRSTWDSFHRPQEFLRWTWYMKHVSRLYNSYDAITWNIDKHSLLALRERAIPIIPTHCSARAQHADLAGLWRQNNWPRAVLKPIVSANGYNAIEFDASQIAQAQQRLDEIFANHPGAMLQPYLASISESGVRHPFTANEPDQQLAGRLYRAEELPRAERALAQSISLIIEEETQTCLLCARIDRVTDESGKKMLIEAEIIEPVLRLEFPGAAERFIAGLLERAALPVTLSPASQERPGRQGVTVPAA